jgi:hypothetical protein
VFAVLLSVHMDSGLFNALILVGYLALQRPYPLGETVNLTHQPIHVWRCNLHPQRQAPFDVFESVSHRLTFLFSNATRPRPVAVSLPLLQAVDVTIPLSSKRTAALTIGFGSNIKSAAMALAVNSPGSVKT